MQLNNKLYNKMKFHLMKNIIFLLILSTIGCDSGGYLLIKNENIIEDVDKKVINYNGLTIEVSMATLSNIYLFELVLMFNSNNELEVYVDSLKIYYADKQIKDLKIRNDKGVIKNKNLMIKEHKSVLSYSFYLDKNSVTLDNEILVTAPNYIMQKKELFNIDTLIFDMTKYY